MAYPRFYDRLAADVTVPALAEKVAPQELVPDGNVTWMDKIIPDKLPFSRHEMFDLWPMALFELMPEKQKRSVREMNPELFFNTGVPNSNPINPAAMPIDPRLMQRPMLPTLQDPLVMGPTDIPLDNPYLNSTNNPYIRDIVYTPVKNNINGGYDAFVNAGNIPVGMVPGAYAGNGLNPGAAITTNRAYNEYMDALNNSYLSHTYAAYNNPEPSADAAAEAANDALSQYLISQWQQQYPIKKNS